MSTSALDQNTATPSPDEFKAIIRLLTAAYILRYGPEAPARAAGYALTDLLGTGNEARAEFDPSGFLDWHDDPYGQPAYYPRWHHRLHNTCSMIVHLSRQAPGQPVKLWRRASGLGGSERHYCKPELHPLGDPYTFAKVAFEGGETEVATFTLAGTDHRAISEKLLADVYKALLTEATPK